MTANNGEFIQIDGNMDFLFFGMNFMFSCGVSCSSSGAVKGFECTSVCSFHCDRKPKVRITN